MTVFLEDAGFITIILEFNEESVGLMGHTPGHQFWKHLSESCVFVFEFALIFILISDMSLEFKPF